MTEKSKAPYTFGETARGTLTAFFPVDVVVAMAPNIPAQREISCKGLFTPAREHKMHIMATQSSPTTHEVTVELPVPCDVHWIVFHLRSSSFGAVYSFDADDRLSRVQWLAGVPCFVETSTSRSPGRLSVRATAPSFPPGLNVEDELSRQLRFMWGLDDDLAGFSSCFAADSVLGPLVSRFYGLRLPKAPSLYECLLVAVVGQQVSVAAAQSIRRKMIERFGAEVEAGGVLRRGYPSAGQLLDAGEDGLRQAGVSRQKCRYLKEIARRAASGEFCPGRFQSLDDESARALLMEIPGIGRWTAEIALMRGLGRLDVFPAGDLGLASALRQQLALTARPSEPEIRSLAERWRPYRSYAAFYLWMTLAKGAL